MTSSRFNRPRILLLASPLLPSTARSYTSSSRVFGPFKHSCVFGAFNKAQSANSHTLSCSSMVACAILHVHSLEPSVTMVVCRVQYMRLRRPSFALSPSGGSVVSGFIASSCSARGAWSWRARSLSMRYNELLWLPQHATVRRLLPRHYAVRTCVCACVCVLLCVLVRVWTRTPNFAYLPRSITASNLFNFLNISFYWLYDQFLKKKNFPQWWADMLSLSLSSIRVWITLEKEPLIIISCEVCPCFGPRNLYRLLTSIQNQLTSNMFVLCNNLQKEYFYRIRPENVVTWQPKYPHSTILKKNSL